MKRLIAWWRRVWNESTPRSPDVLFGEGDRREPANGDER